MLKLYSIVILLFTITSCASNVKVSQSKYNSVWIKAVKGKSVLAPNGYLYTFKENGNVELAKSSIDPNKVIRINIHSYTNNSFDVIISLVNGTIKLKNNTNN